MPYIQFRNIKVVVNASILHLSKKPKFMNWAKEVEVIEEKGLIRVLRLDWDDEPYQELKQLREAILFLHEALHAGQNALIHCGQGKSRSGAMLVAFLMAKMGLSYDEALAVAKSKRPIIKPNQGFEDQLRKFESSQLLCNLRKELNS
uniref:protein-tyrosine-phosphatase n=1 Tax=Arcella intermedia TaxID=1963864 RepID=A0A6B2LMX6_9EUKA